MEEDIYSVPVKGRKVKNTQAETWQETGDNWKERVVDIYANFDANVAGPQAQEQEPTAQSVTTSETHTAPANPQSKNHLNTAAGCLALLCLLLLAGLVALAIHYFTVTRLNEELQSTLGNMVEERNRFQTAYNTTLKQQGTLRKNLHGNLCTCWQNSSCSCYYISESFKTWQDSRRDCQERGSDLIVINSRDEQEFVKDFKRRVWLGLTDAEKEGTWKWVDGTHLTTAYWGPRQPDNHGTEGEDCVEHNTWNEWNDMQCGFSNLWICEKNLDQYWSVFSNLHD